MQVQKIVVVQSIGANYIREYWSLKVFIIVSIFLLIRFNYIVKFKFLFIYYFLIIDK